MPAFSPLSEQRLATCHPDLQKVLRAAIQHMDFAVLCGHRGEAEQNQAAHDGASKLRWPNSKHNASPSYAVDIAPFPIDWKDRERFILLAGVILGTAQQLNIRLRWGADWNMNFQIKDDAFQDLPHFELV